MSQPNPPPDDTLSGNDRSMCELKLLVPADLFRAWQRCSWLIIQETERSRVDVMEEMVRDFLIKHDC